MYTSNMRKTEWGKPIKWNIPHSNFPVFQKLIPKRFYAWTPSFDIKWNAGICKMVIVTQLHNFINMYIKSTNQVANISIIEKFVRGS